MSTFNFQLLLLCASSEKFSLIIQFKMVIEHPQQMSDVQFFMFFKAERLTDLWLGLNEIQQFQCTHSLVDICICSWMVS